MTRRIPKLPKPLLWISPILLLPLLLLGLAASETGSRWLILTLQPLTPVAVASEGIHGSLLDRLDLEGVEINAEPHRGRLARMVLRWRPSALLRGELHIDSIVMSGLTLELGRASENQSESGAQPALPSFPLRLDEFKLDDAQVTQEGRRYRLKSVRFSLRMQQDRIAVNGGWGKIADENDYVSEPGSVEISGEPEAYRIKIQTRIGGVKIPQTSVEVMASGNADGITLKPLRLDTLGGQLLVTGPLQWGKNSALDLRLVAEGLHPKQFHPELPESLGATIKIGGRFDKETPQLEASIEALNGELKGQLIKGSGRLHWTQERVQVEALSVQIGANRVRADGAIAREALFDLDLEMPKLEQLWPGLGGSLRAKGRIKGDLRTPLVEMNARADKLFVGKEIGAAGADLAIRWNPLDAKGSHTNLAITDIRAPSLDVAKVTLKGPGNLADHRWSVAILAKPFSADLQLEGGFKAPSWNGKITKGGIAPTQGTVWRLAKPFDLTLGGEKVRFGRHCWRNADASICSNGEWLDDRGLSAKAKLERAPLALLQPLLPKGDVVDGEVDGLFESEGPKQKATLTIAAASYRPAMRTTPLTLGLRKLRIDANIDPKRIESRFGLEVQANTAQQGQWGSAKGRVILNREGRPAVLAGEVRLDYPDIAPLAVFIGRVTEPKGSLALRATLAGSLEKPLIKGELALKEASLKIPDLGLAINEIGLQAASTGGEIIKLSGSARSGLGRLRLDGSFEPAGRQGRSLRLQIQGENFSAIRLPEAEVEISPDLLLRMEREKLSLGGKVLVPRAEITLKELPENSVQVSEDVVIVGQRKKKPQKAQRPMALDSKIEVKLGDKVRFNGFGLKTRVSGTTRIETLAGRPPSGHGNLSLLDGSYKAYGQDLKIQRGRILFAGPLDNPGLDFRASRTVDDDITVGLQVTGNANSPALSVYSKPPMPQRDALSYLLTGRKGGDYGGGDAMSATAALWSLGKPGSEGISDKIRKQAGLDELRLGGDSLEQGAVVLGKQLNPNLYLRYVQGLFDNASAVELRYKLTDALEIKASGGKNQSVDLNYRIER